MSEDIVERGLHLAQQRRDGRAGEGWIEQLQRHAAVRAAARPDVGVVGVAVRDQHRLPRQRPRIEQAEALLEQLAQRVPIADPVDRPAQVREVLPG